ncbi:MAG: hypothetical protein ACK47B_23780 [Armatimonadota bacterium]
MENGLKPFGVRDAELQEREERGPEAFSVYGEGEKAENMRKPQESAGPAEPEYYDVGEIVPVTHPTRPDTFVSVKVCAYRVSLGRARFGRQRTEIRNDQGKRKPEVSYATLELDPEGLFLYECEHAIADFSYTKRNGKVVKFNPHQERTNRLAYQEFPEWFGAWVQDQIHRINGWGREAEQAEDEFRKETA